MKEIILSGADYLAHWRGDPRLVSVVPVPVAADLLDVATTTIERWFRAGDMTRVKLAPGVGSRNKNEITCVLVREVDDRLRARAREQDQVRDLLIDVASKRQPPVWYEAVMTPLKLDTQLSADRARIAGILDAVSRRTWEEHEFLLSVLVHRKPASGKKESMPSNGFFDMADKIGIAYDSQEQLVRNQLDKVYAHYGR